MQAAKCTIFQSTFLGMSEDPKKDGCWENMSNTIQKGKKEPFKYVDRLEIAFAEIEATNPDDPSLTYKGPNAEKANKTIKEAKRQNPKDPTYCTDGVGVSFGAACKGSSEGNVKA